MDQEGQKVNGSVERCAGWRAGAVLPASLVGEVLDAVEGCYGDQGSGDSGTVADEVRHAFVSAMGVNYEEPAEAYRALNRLARKLSQLATGEIREAKWQTGHAAPQLADVVSVSVQRIHNAIGEVLGFAADVAKIAGGAK